MSKIPKEVVIWNRFIRGMQASEKHWKALQDFLADKSSRDIELMDEKAQRFLTKGFIKAKYAIMLPRFVDFWRTLGGLQELLIPTKEDRRNARSS